MQPSLPQRITIINHPARLEKTNPKRTQFKPNFNIFATPKGAR